MLPNCVKDFLEYKPISDLEDIGTAEIQAFYEQLQNRPHKRKSEALSESFINHHVYALKVFFAWLEETGELAHNPMSVMKFKQPRHKTREPLSQEEIKKLFACCSTEKERAILHLFYSCGLRRTEGQTLNTTDIHFKQNLLYVREGKGAKRRVVPMTEKVSAELAAYFFNEREKQKNAKNEDAFMLNKTGERMSGNSFNKVLKELIGRSGLKNETIPASLAPQHRNPPFGKRPAGGICAGFFRPQPSGSNPDLCKSF